MTDKPVDPLTYEDLEHFGTIVHTFARIELLMQSTLGRLVRLAGGSDDTVDMVITITKPMTYAQKRDTLFSFLEIYKVSQPGRTEIETLFEAAHKHYALRNHIAHSLWRHGKRPTAVKPAYLDLRQGKGKIGGYRSLVGNLSATY